MTTSLTKTKNTKSRSFYFREVQRELKKVNWTSKEDLKVATKVVLGSIFAFGIAIYLVDLVIKGGLDALTSFVRWFGG